AGVGCHVPPPPGLAPPSRWGMEEHLDDLFRGSASDIHTTYRDFVFRYRSPEHWVDVFRTWYGPVHKAFAGLSADGQRRLEQDLISLINDFNSSGDATMVVPSEYVEVVVVKKRCVRVCRTPRARGPSGARARGASTDPIRRAAGSEIESGRRALPCRAS